MSITETTYPEIPMVGFSRWDGTVHFYSRVRSAIMRSECRRVLNVGCGRGLCQDDSCDYRRQLQTLNNDCASFVIGIDIDPAAGTNPAIDEFRLINCGDHWPVERESVDVVVCDYVLEHVTSPAAFLGEVQRVLKPGGVFAARTPNAWGYPALVSRLIPNRYHARIVPRDADDVFPTRYRANTCRSLRRYLDGMRTVIYTIESEPRYLECWPWLYRVAGPLHRLIPPYFRSTLLVFACKVS